MVERVEYLIGDVAIYLRKSRGDVDKDLEAHKRELVSLCRSMKVSYKIYQEIGSSDSIDDRPEFSRLLNDIKLELYDAIVVMDIDRIGRGDEEDWGRIEKIIRAHEVFIITPDKIYNLRDDNDEIQLEVKKFLARIEYKMTTKRLHRGKVRRAKELGEWTNGSPPFPYVYNRDTRSLEIDPEKQKVYDLIKIRALTGLSAEAIAWELNSLGYSSPGGKNWSSTAVYRLLFDKTHLGKIVFGKQKGSGHKNRKHKAYQKIAEDKWFVVQGKHTAIKTQDEHDRIVELFAKRKKIPKAARSGAKEFSGLVYCGKCGCSMQFTENGTSGEIYVKKCQKTDSLGHHCGNRGVNIRLLEVAIFDELQKRQAELENKNFDVLKTELIVLKDDIAEMRKRI